MTQISFKASFVKNAQIQQTLSNNQTREKTVSIVELDKNNFHDRFAMRDVAMDWEKNLRLYQPEGHNYATGIADSMISWAKPEQYETNHYFLITKQKKNFEHITPEDVLGAAQFTEKKYKKNELAWLQVDPKTNYKPNGNREFKGVGKALVEHIKTISKKPFEVFSDPDAINFYTKLGLKYKEKTGMLTYTRPFNFKQFCKDILSKF